MAFSLVLPEEIKSLKATAYNSRLIDSSNWLTLKAAFHVFIIFLEPVQICKKRKIGFNLGSLFSGVPALHPQEKASKRMIFV